ncbi:MAG TPA: hypothetical protein VL295_02285, partial [Gemmatimonadales bacterium]|nr:hypothetical protein [Gemmatimonadales bacterium]
MALGAALYGSAYWRVRQSAARAASERLTAVVHQISGLLETQGVAIARAALEAGRGKAVLRALQSPAPATSADAFAALRGGSAQDTSIAALVLRDSTGGVLFTDGALGPELASLMGPDELPTTPHDTAVVGHFRALGGQIYFPAVAELTAGERRLGYVVTWRRTGKAPHARGPVAALIGSDAVLLIGSRTGAWMDESGPAQAPDLEARVRDGLSWYDRPEGPVIAAMADVAG